MFLLKKVFQLRDKVNPDAEKPFLEHLEDLRAVVTRIVITLLITTVISYSFRNILMDVMRRPITEVWETHSANKLPKKNAINPDSWEKAKSAADVIASLPETAKKTYVNELSKADQSNAQIAIYYRGAITLNKEQQNRFLTKISDLNSKEKETLVELITLKPDPVTGSRDRFKFMSSLQPTEAFMLSIKLAFFAGIVLSIPFLMFFLLQFILPGLHQKEKKALYPGLAIGFGLFLCGVLFAYFYVLPSVLEFFYSYGESMAIANEWRIGLYLSFATQFTLIFGLCFELPVVVWILVKLGLLNYEIMSRTRSYAFISILVIAAVITPTPDAFTLCLLAIPMTVLYELSIWLAWWDAKKQEKAEVEERALHPKKIENLDEVKDLDLDPQQTEEGEDEDFYENYKKNITE
jgi:sec-independent protein translocase protein TatC